MMRRNILRTFLGRPTLTELGKREKGTASAVDTRYFDKVLIANRGEIACRVIKTCRRLGIKTVAIHSTADRYAKHVALADEAVQVGPPPTKDSYLRIDRILDACKELGVDAVHPGYGFLSENAEFSKALAEHGIEFVGPTCDAIDAMGDKIHSKILAQKAGVNIIPGIEGEVHTIDEMLQAAKTIGYPIMIKASAGGGGKGMRIAWNEKQARVEWEVAKREAKSSFGDDRMLVEKYVDNPRHIEIQVLGDKHGTALYLPERECSIQRRNQKVIEEAPSKFIDPKTRKAMGEQAAALARAVKYHTAGTVEMLVDSSKNFYFLEMNTRLQVEHPITEEITGLDLVEEMLRAAKGLPLSVTQDQVKINGWATECRVYAEDPTRNYAPSIGRLSRYVEPVGEGVRVDSGITEGSEISVFYDPLIAKLVTHAPTREECIQRMEDALDDYVVRGLRHNIALLRDVLSKDDYRSGDISTKFLPKEYPEGFQGHDLTPREAEKVITVASLIRFIRARWLDQAPGSIRLKRPLLTLEFVCTLGDEAYNVVVTQEGEKFIVTVNGNKMVLDHPGWKIGEEIVHVNFGEKVETFQLLDHDELTFSVQYLGTPYDVGVYRPMQYECKKFMPPPKVIDTSKILVAPMPGAVIAVKVKPGDKVSQGQEIVIMEAMKMQQGLLSPVDGVVKAVNVEKDQTVEDEFHLIEFE